MAFQKFGKMSMRAFFFGFLFWICGGSLLAQTADVTSGCIPLTVQFTGPSLSAYNWDFGDAASSNLQNPQHIYTQAGTFTVILREGSQGPEVGRLEITVYADPIIRIEGVPQSGCSPLQVTFSPQIDVDDDIAIVGYLWSFGDGNSSTAENPQHTYQNSGTFTVSLEVTTNLEACNKTELFVDYIVAEGVTSAFTASPMSTCNVPANITFNNTTDHSDDNMYLWDFGNGQTSALQQPGSVTYDASGTYSVSLTVTNREGCASTFTRTVVVGPPDLMFSIKDTACVRAFLDIQNTTSAAVFEWDFGPDANFEVSDLRSPIIWYRNGGDKTITLTAFNDSSCKSDTTFQVYIDAPDPTFTLDPLISCHNPAMIRVNATQNDAAVYTWNDTIFGGPTNDIPIVCPPRDSLHINRRDTFLIHLEVESVHGCIDTLSQIFVHRKPDAHFIPSPTSGCAPLTVNFEDFSQSTENIVRWKWLYGTGDEAEFTVNDDHAYTFDQAGEYYVRLVIENDEGCIDTSAGVWIHVGEPIPGDYGLDRDEICLGETIEVTLTTADDRIDSWHFTSDNDRFSHCWDSNTGSHAFVTEPGIFDATITTEYNGCYWRQTDTDVITVNGAKANLAYMTNCDSTHVVMFESESINATNLLWDLGDGDSMFVETFNHTYADRGSYTVYLEASDPASGCPTNVDSAEVFIKDLVAAFDMEELVCDNEEYMLDASASQDVYEACSKGYLWVLPDHRPRELGDDTLRHTFGIPGDNDVTLIVEDINGCRDTTTRKTRVFSISPTFEMDENNVCLPAEIAFTDQSTSDTTLVEWSWSFGSGDQHPTHTFPEGDQTSIDIFMTATDAIGCSDQFSRTLSIYKPESQIQFSPGPGICIGQSIQFNASDYTEQGSFLNFDWDFGPFGQSALQNPAVEFDQSGVFEVVLNYEEDASGCQGRESVLITVVKIPEAAYTTNVDNAGVICHPAIIEFTNTSDTEGPIAYSWMLGDLANSGEVNPTLGFPKGTHTVQLVVRSPFGCSDTTFRDFVLVGPEGDFDADKTIVCLGDEITFTLRDTVDVGSFIWEFGDGRSQENVNPVTHVYDFKPDSEGTKMDLILESFENGCEHIVTLPITIDEVIADFVHVDTLTHCPGLAIFENTSVGANQFQWDFGNGQQSMDTDPTVIFDRIEPQQVTLQSTNSATGCSDVITKTIELEDVIDFYFFPNVFTPNGDQRNDFFNVAVLDAFKDVVEVKTFRIYNRWGNLVYDNDDPQNGWDGTYNGEAAPVEVYAYFIEIDILNCGTQTKKGNVTIVR